MKKVFFMITLAVFGFVSNANAQWEKPADDGQTAPRKALFSGNKKSKEIPAKYLVGGVPEVDGKVVWNKSFEVEGKDAKAIYTELLSYLQKFVKGPEQTDKSQIAIVNETTKQIVVRPQEWLVFENKPLSLDRTKFRYTMVVDCKNGGFDVQIGSIRYIYEEDRPSAMNVSAEEWITDKEALNKKKTGFQKGVKKFRMKTIDRIEGIFEGLGNLK